ncbi:GNL3L/Grn1 putative GTPase-domain-containing protein [Fomes fomentarius]|nr:GNL3L/Grn1 putative GTPase-domain-containing protein [Fomes fomentarius]
MPRIRKKTSKRVTLNRRERIKKKVKESRKKKGKEAKKNPQWKSKHAKDPGIPNNFPYKDEILAEVAEQRRLAAEEKQRRKEEKQAAKAQGDAADGSNAGEEEDVAFDGVRALAPQRALEAGPGDRMDVDADEGEGEEEAEEDVPVLINPDLPNLKAVLDAADVVVQVLDARDPLASRSAHLEEVVQGLGKRLVLVLNKVDACPKEAVQAWAATLRQYYPTLLFRSATACLPVSSVDAVNIKGKGKGKERERADDAWGLDAVVALLRSWAENKQGGISVVHELIMSFMDLFQVGKTSFINSLLRKAVLETYRLTSTPSDSPTTTTHPQEVTVELEGGQQLRVIDTPGLSWHPTDDASPDDTARIRARDILLRNRGRIERLKDPSPVLSELVSRASREDLMLAYNLPIFTDGDANAFLAGVARANNFIKKKGDPDLAGAARMVLRDWSSGKLARFTLPPSSTSSSPSSPSSHASPAADPALAEIYATKDPSVLAHLRARKELRKAGGLVKLRPGEVDTRKLVLDASFFLSSDDEGMDGDEEDGGAVDDADEVGLPDGEESEESYASDEDEEGDEEEGSDEEDEDEDEEDEEDELASPPKGKRKRVLAKAPARPAKRVAFAAEPRGTKQARSAAGAKGAAASKAMAKAKGKEATKVTKKPAKAAVLAKPPKAAAPAAKKIANAASSKKSGASAPAKDGEVAYDFKQFFH